MALLKKLNVDVLTGWRRPHVVLVDSEEWAADDDLHNLPSLDILLAFEDYSRVREREFEDQMRRERVEKRRRERKARVVHSEFGAHPGAGPRSVFGLE